VSRQSFYWVVYGLLAVSAALYGVSFVLPTFVMRDSAGVEVHLGYQAFTAALCSPLLGPEGGALRIAVLLWLANPIYWRGSYHLVAGRYMRAFTEAVIATGLAAAFFMLGVASEPDFSPIGYYAWLVSIGLLAVAAGVACAWKGMGERKAERIELASRPHLLF
jgi:hypothetical protein